MKKRYSVLLLLLFASAILVSQTGTIKVVKPIPPKATPPPPPPAPKQRFGIGFEIGTNYTFKGIDKVGFNAGVSFPIRHPFSIGLQYSYQDQYYRLSPFNTETLTSETSHSTSEKQIAVFKDANHIFHSNDHRKYEKNTRS